MDIPILSTVINYIRDYKNEALKEYLDFNTNIISTDMEHLVGTAIAFNNIIAMALLNLYIREYNVLIRKQTVAKIIYNNECYIHQKRYRLQGCYISYQQYNDEKYSQYADLFIEKINN